MAMDSKPDQNRCKNYIWGVLMEAGLTIFNDKNTAQIDSLHSNIQYVSKGSYTFPYYYGVYSFGLTYVSIPYTEGDIIAFDAFNRFSILGVWRDTPNTIRYALIGERKDLTQNYYIFRHGQINPGHHFEVYGENGNLVYSDGSQFMKVLGHASGNAALIETPLTVGVLKYTMKAAIVVGTSNHNHLFWFHGGSVDLHYPWFNNLGDPRFNFFVIDVTGL